MSMTFLDNPPRCLFFTGKGGVGKTSLACASAVFLADAGKRVLLVSTDPASNVGQVFSIEIGNRVTAVESVPGLSALEIDPQQAAQQYRDRIVTPVRGVLPDDVVAGIEEQLSGACTTEIAAFDEFTELLTDNSLRDKFDHVIFDTAPTGHTIRLLQLPGAWSGFLDSGKGDASCLGPLAGLEKQRLQYRAAVDALADSNETRMVLVARAQLSTLREAARSHDELAAVGLQRQHLVINGLLPDQEARGDKLADAIRQRESLAIAEMPTALKVLPLDTLSLKAFNLTGLDALRGLLDETAFSDDGKALSAPDVPDVPPLSSLIDELAENGHGLIMVMGKGGVGKTTIAAAVAASLAERGLPVHLTTSDPAAHLSETLAEHLDTLELSRIDPQAETERYRHEVMATKGADLDDEGRALLEEDLRSPCTEEIAVFQAFSRIIRQAGRKFVVMDTAPTGHTLLLLDATGAYHREVARQFSGSQTHFSTPMMQLQDQARTQVLLVTLAETTPVLEATGLQEDLRRAGIEPWAWVINNSIAAAQTDSPLLRRRAANEIAEIEKVMQQHAERVALIPLKAEEPIGLQRLLTLSENVS